MNILKKIRSYIPFFILTLCLGFNQYYQTQQEKFILETNSLRLASHTNLSLEEFSKMTKKTEQSDQDFWIVQRLQSEKEEILNIFSNDWAKLPFPIKNGKMITKNNVSEALIGESIPTVKQEGEEYIIYFGQKYQVIGKIGNIKRGPLSRTIVLSDNDILTYGGEFSFNGSLKDSTIPHSKDIGDNRGVERIFSLSDFSSLLTLTTLLFVLISTFYWIDFMVRKNQKTNQILHTLGKNRQALFLEQLVVLLVSSILIISIISLSLILVVPIKTLMYHYLALIITEIFSFIYLFYRGTTHQYGA